MGGYYGRNYNEIYNVMPPDYNDRYNIVQQVDPPDNIIVQLDDPMEVDQDPPPSNKRELDDNEPYNGAKRRKRGGSKIRKSKSKRRKSKRKRRNSKTKRR